MKIVKAQRITPQPARCIEVDSPDRLFAAGGAKGDSILSHNSVAQRNIVFSAIMRPESWRFLGIDLKRVELSVYRAYSNVVLGVATTLEDALTVLRFAQMTMMKRYTEMETLGFNNFLDLPNKGQALMVMVDEAGELLGSSGVRALGANTYVPNMNGRRNISEIEIGDVVFDNFGKHTVVLDKYIPEFHEQFDMTIRNAQSVSSGKLGREIIRTGGDHYWVVYCPNEEHIDAHVMTTRQLFEELSVTDANKTWKIKRVRNGIETKRQELSVSPFDLGEYLSGQLTLSSKDLAAIGLQSGAKGIPDRYMYSSRAQREELLDGIFGPFVDRPVFTTDDLYLVQDIQRLISSLGFTPILFEVESGIEISYEDGAGLWFEIDSITPVESADEEEMFCLRVDSPESQFLCTENFITTHNTDEGREQDALKGEATMIIGSIARLGRAAGVHLVVATQRPDATLIPGEVKANFGARLNCGRSDSNASSMILGNGEGTRIKPNPRGRLYLSIFGRGDHAQGFFAEQSWIDDWLASKGLNPDGSPLSQKQSRLAKLTNFETDFGEGADLDTIEGVDNASVIEKIRRQEAGLEGIDDDDWGFADESPSDNTQEQAPADGSVTAERTDDWGGLQFEKVEQDRHHRAVDDWDDDLDELIKDNFD